MGMQSKVKWMNENLFPGLAPRTFFHHWSLWPIHACCVVGVVWCAIFSARTYFFNPDSTVLDPHYYETYRNKDFKFFNKSGVTVPCPAPIYRREGDPPDESYALDPFPHRKRLPFFNSSL